jgi:hypothetical protein
VPIGIGEVTSDGLLYLIAAGEQPKNNEERRYSLAVFPIW